MQLTLADSDLLILSTAVILRDGLPLKSFHLLTEKQWFPNQQWRMSFFLPFCREGGQRLCHYSKVTLSMFSCHLFTVCSNIWTVACVYRFTPCMLNNSSTVIVCHREEGRTFLWCSSIGNCHLKAFLRPSPHPPSSAPFPHKPLSMYLWKLHGKCNWCRHSECCCTHADGSMEIWWRYSNPTEVILDLVFQVQCQVLAWYGLMKP